MRHSDKPHSCSRLCLSRAPWRCWAWPLLELVWQHIVAASPKILIASSRTVCSFQAAPSGNGWSCFVFSRLPKSNGLVGAAAAPVSAAKQIFRKNQQRTTRNTASENSRKLDMLLRNAQTRRFPKGTCDMALAWLRKRVRGVAPIATAVSHWRQRRSIHAEGWQWLRIRRTGEIASPESVHFRE